MPTWREARGGSVKWLRRRFRRRRPKRASRLDRQVRLGLLQDAMGRAEQRQDDPRQDRKTGRGAGAYPVAVGVSKWLGPAGG
jgi:hypothetical protein